MSLRRTLEKILRGWLPKDPIMPENRLKSIRKPIAVLLGVTMLLASVSAVYFLTIVNRPLPPNLPELLSSATPTPQITPIPTSESTLTPTQTPSPTSSQTSHPTTTSLAPSFIPWTFPSSTYPASTPQPTIQPITTTSPTPSPTPAPNMTAPYGITYGGNGTDVGYSIIETADGGFAMAGTTTLFGSGDIDAWIVKTNTAGTMQWNKTYGGQFYDEAKGILQDNDGGYIVAGTTSSFGSGARDAWIFKIDSNGNLEWNKTYGGSGDDRVYSLSRAKESGYVLIGYTSSFGYDGNVWLLKTDTNGNIQLNKAYASGKGVSGIQTSDGGYAVLGEFNKGGRVDTYIVKTDKDGRELWNHTWQLGVMDFPSCVIQTSDGGYVFTGTGAGWSSANGYTIRTDANGTMLGNSGGVEVMTSVVQTIDGGIAVAGTAVPYGKNTIDIYFEKRSAISDLEWSRTFGGPSVDRGEAIIQTADGGYALLGITSSYGNGESDFYLLLFNSAGELRLKL